MQFQRLILASFTSVLVPTSLVILLNLASCTQAYRVFPSTHHVPAFTAKKQLSTQVGVRNQHVAYSLTDHWAVKGSYFRRNISYDNSFEQWGEEHKAARTGNYYDAEFGVGYFNPAKPFMREIFVGAGFGETDYRYHAAPYSGKPNYQFKSDNVSVYGQYSFEWVTGIDSRFFITYKTKWMYMGNIHGGNRNAYPLEAYRYSPTNNEDCLWFNQVSASFRQQVNDYMYLQAQTGLSFQNKYMNLPTDYRALWLEFSVGFTFGQITPNKESSFWNRFE